MIRIGIIILLLLAVVVGVVIFTQVQSHEGYFSPVYSPDGQEVYFITRQTRGLVTGLGVEFFTPPAHVFVWRDRFFLQKLNAETGQVEVLKTWPPSPLEGEHIRTYRGRAFSVISTQLRWVDDVHLEYKIRVRIPSQPSAEQYFVSRRWNDVTSELDEKDEWSKDWVALSGGDVSPLSNEWEVIAPRGGETFPSAIVAYNSSSGAVRVLHKNEAFEHVFPQGITPAELEPLARRADIERIQELKDTHQRLMREALAEGMSESEASLEVIRRMRELGYYPEPPQLVARLLSEGDLDSLRVRQELDPVFAITQMQFTVGLFQDIEKALESPGEPVEKSMGKYVIHDDYTTSQELNKFLQRGGDLFYVETNGQVFELKIEKPDGQ